jgi:fumarate hydratase subunit beta
VVKKTGSGWIIICTGPTGSSRFDKAEVKAIEEFGVRIIVGKGGMSAETRGALKRKGAAFLASMGGCASFYGRQISRVKEAHWIDLGLPEAIWALEMNHYGPLLVTMDSQERSVYDELEVGENLRKICMEKGMHSRGTCRRERFLSVIPRR